MTRIYKTETAPDPVADVLAANVAIAAPAPVDHCRLAPSSASRWIPCPYSAKSDLPQYTNESAELGTEAHGWGAKVITKKAGLAEVPETFRDGVAMYAEHVFANNCPRPIVERKWESMEIDEFGGTIDCLLLMNGKAAIYDFKFGVWPVKAADNPQLLCYATIIAEHFNIEQFYGVIIQPRAFNKEVIQVAEYSLEQVSEHREKVIEAAASDAKVTGEHCLWCPLLRSKQCNTGHAYAVEKGWTEKYKHLGATGKGKKKK